MKPTILIIFFYLVQFATANAQSFVVSGTIDNSTQADTLTLTWWDQFLTTQQMYNAPLSRSQQVTCNGSFCLRTSSLRGPVYFTLSRGADRTKRSNILLLLYVAFPGDSIEVSATNGNVSFAGRSASFFTCQSELRKTAKSVEQEVQKGRSSLNPSTFVRFSQKLTNEINSVYQAEYNVLSTYENILFPRTMQFLHMEIQAKRLQQLAAIHLLALQGRIANIIRSTEKQTLVRDSLAMLYQTEIKRFIGDYPDSIKLFSKEYMAYLMLSEKINRFEKNDLLFQTLLQNRSSLLRDRLVSMYFIEQAKLNNMDTEISTALKVIRDTFSLRFLEHLREKLSIGSVAYRFSLPDDTGKMMRLENMKGKVVFMDFWFTGCTGCKSYYTTVLHDLEKKYAGNPNISFVSISIDTNKNRWLRSIEEGGYTGREAINLFTAGKGTDHDVIREFNVTSYPRPILIDPTGRILSMNSEELRDGHKLEQFIVSALTKKEPE